MARPDADRLAGRPRDAAPDRAVTAVYIEKMAKELSGLALRDGLPTLAYLLDVARLEAALRVSGPVEGEVERFSPRRRSHAS